MILLVRSSRCLGGILHHVLPWFQVDGNICLPATSCISRGLRPREILLASGKKNLPSLSEPRQTYKAILNTTSLRMLISFHISGKRQQTIESNTHALYWLLGDMKICLPSTSYISRGRSPRKL